LLKKKGNLWGNKGGARGKGKSIIKDELTGSRRKLGMKREFNWSLTSIFPESLKDREKKAEREGIEVVRAV